MKGKIIGSIIIVLCLALGHSPGTGQTAGTEEESPLASTGYLQQITGGNLHTCALTSQGQVEVRR